MSQRTRHEPAPVFGDDTRPLFHAAYEAIIPDDDPRLACPAQLAAAGGQTAAWDELVHRLDVLLLALDGLQGRSDRLILNFRRDVWPVCRVASELRDSLEGVVTSARRVATPRP